MTFKDLGEHVSETGASFQQDRENIPSLRINISSHIRRDSTLLLPLRYKWNDISVDIVANGLA